MVVPFTRLAVIPSTTFSKTINLGFELQKFYNLSTGVGEYIRSNVRAVYSSKFTYNGISCTMQDDGNGVLGIYSFSSTGTHTFVKSIGTVDYTSGLIRINNLLVTAFEGSTINLHYNPVSKDITSTKNTILLIKDSDVETTAVQIKEWV